MKPLSYMLGIAIISIGIITASHILPSHAAYPLGTQLLETSTSDLSNSTISHGSTTIVIASQSETLKNQTVFKRPISCTLQVNHVHASHHVSDTINGTAKVTCSGNAGSIQLYYSLIRVTPRNRQWATPIRSNTNKSSLSTNRAVPCSEGPARFQGWSQATITPPKGYVLSGKPDYKKYGKSTWVGCGGTKLPKPVSNDPAETLTVTFVPTSTV